MTAEAAAAAAFYPPSPQQLVTGVHCLIDNLIKSSQRATNHRQTTIKGSPKIIKSKKEISKSIRIQKLNCQ